MSELVIGAVLIGALLHASWNALVKVGGDRWLSPALIAGFSAVFGMTLIALMPMPHPEHWPWLIVSGSLHLTYFTLLVISYGIGDFGRVYPIARGTAPLFVCIAAGPFLDESLSTMEVISVSIIAIGVMSLSLEQDLIKKQHRKVVIYALLTGISLAAVTLVDASGIRIMSSSIKEAPLVYLAWIMTISCVPFVSVVTYFRRKQILRYLRSYGGRGAIGATFALASYALILWAFSEAPASSVAAIRETGVIFAAIISAFFLGESYWRRRIPAAILVAIGAAGLHLAN
ncbi:MAG: hypothetical protein CL568_08955 [Alphaproteobacteria bacterium]|jgi:drug/metabolite transporter (DMT)-like permease|nr:hypothetical protein [Alphaproteobacteria bacterium]PPR13832.1 MAG: hypothetical protein CFH42_00695 [Alphaproteobacteria bacterium MarineAlpha12_Bin1]|tara:strand:+ start:11307 stop:12167 length:861 start_codon:yes stop_codon:yes gene_type:complete